MSEIFRQGKKVFVDLAGRRFECSWKSLKKDVRVGLVVRFTATERERMQTKVEKLKDENLRLDQENDELQDENLRLEQQNKELRNHLAKSIELAHPLTKQMEEWKCQNESKWFRKAMEFAEEMTDRAVYGRTFDRVRAAPYREWLTNRKK